MSQLVLRKAIKCPGLNKWKIRTTLADYIKDNNESATVCVGPHWFRAKGWILVQWLSYPTAHKEVK